jgi:hypothetical protein
LEANTSAPSPRTRRRRATRPPDTLLYQGTLLGKTGYHFVTNVKIGKFMVKCQDWRKPDGIYSKADAEAMLAACKTLKKK